MKSFKIFFDENVQHTLDEKNHDTIKKMTKIPKKNSLEGIQETSEICQIYKGNNNVHLWFLKEILFHFQKSWKCEKKWEVS